MRKREKEDKQVVEEKDRTDPLIWTFAMFALVKQERKSFRKLMRRFLILARAGIDYLIWKTGGEKEPTKVKKIEIK